MSGGVELFGTLFIPTWVTVLAIGMISYLNSAALLVWGERRIAGFIQNRLGPNRVGPFGILQPMADVLKLLLKEDVTPIRGYKTIHTFAPMIPVITALMTVAVIPFGDGLYVTDINAGVLYLLAIASLGVYGVTLAGWSSNSKYSLLGGLRAAAQMVSYELPMGMAVASVVVIAGSLSVVEVAASQQYIWNIFINPIGGVIFITAAFAEAHRTPFDLVEAEQELVGGFHTEYSGMKFGMFFLAEYMHVLIGSVLITTFFFGSYHFPFAGYIFDHFALWDFWEMHPVLKGLLDVGMFTLKVVFWCFIFILVRWTIPRFKFNQLMKLCWERLLPLSILNFLLIALGMYAYTHWW